MGAGVLSENKEQFDCIYVIDDDEGAVFACVGEERFLEYCRDGKYSSILITFGVTVWDGGEEPIINDNAKYYYDSLLTDQP